MVDPITVSVLTHRFAAIVEEMGEAMLRTAYSQILNSSRDFSTAICDAQARLVAQADHVPIHVGAIPWAVMSVRDFFADRVRPGDVFLLNDPYHGNNHLPDLTAFVPVFVDGQVAFARLMQPGETETLTGQRDITLRVGDPGALSYSINGRSGQPLGTPREPVTVRFDTSGRATRVS